MISTTFNSLGIDNLRFFTGDGHEIVMHKLFSAKWEIVPHNLVHTAFYKNPYGHFELSAAKDLSYLFDDPYPDGNYIISKEVDMTDNYQYDVEVDAYKQQKVLSLQDAYGQEMAYVTSNESKTIKLTVVKLSDTQVQVLSNDDIQISEFTANRIGKFSVRTLATAETKTITETSNTCQIVVDDPGIIRPDVTFVRGAHDRDFIAAHELVQSVSGVVSPNEQSDSYYKEITQNKDNTYTIDNVYDIIFFGYKTIADDTTYYDTNTLRLSLNDGQKDVVQDFNLLDFLRASQQTAIEDNLKVFKSYISPDKDIETFDELMQTGTTATSDIYGITSGLLCEVLMSEFNQYDEDVVKALKNAILYARRNTSFTDVQILKVILSAFNESSFNPEYWDDEYIINIVRGTEDLDTATTFILDYVLYGENAEKTMYKTVARYTVEYNIPEDQYPYVKYFGEVYQERASVGLISSQTIVVVTDNGVNAPQRYTYPVVSEQQSNTEPIQYRLHFKFQNDSEMKFVTMSDDNELRTLDSLYALTPDEINQTTDLRSTNALHFAVGFQADQEGCYDNALGMFIMNTDTEEDNFIGIIKFRTEVEGEDYRYRTLFTNFAIPDPALYPNLFKDKDPGEESTDWRTVNLKSKELFLTYDLIFPYSGTYRALFNAVKFLGYTDLIFKEWYKIKDANDQYKYVAILNYDSSTGKSIPNAIKKYGVDYTEQDRYLKLNRLSMIYHLQEINQDKSENALKVKGYTFNIAGQKVWLPEANTPYRLALYADKYGTLSGDWENIDIIVARNGNYYCPMLVDQETGGPDYIKVVWNTSTKTICRYGNSNNSKCIRVQYGETTLSDPFVVIDGVRYPFRYNYDEIPEVDNIYEYRNDEILAKLYSVKKWLEDFITGVNCYISDINGERIVLERIKTVGYVTEHEVKDLTNEGKFTPRCEIQMNVQDDGTLAPDVFTDSSINLTCSLNEFRSVTFEDYADYPIERFIRWKYDKSSRTFGPETVTVKVDDNYEMIPVYVSAPLNALTVADEYQFEVNTNRVDNGTLYEFMDADSKYNPILIRECEIKMFDDRQTIAKITNNVDGNSSGKCPIIQINKGNLRSLTGDWSPKSDNNNILWSITTIRDPQSDSDENAYTIMTDMSNPERKFTFKGCVNLSPSKTEPVEFIYTTNNKWRLPMFIIKGYDPTNQMRSELVSGGDNANDALNVHEEYVLEVLEGRILFNNHHNPENEAECESAVITIAEPEQVPPDEQDIFVSYTFESERQPIFTFDTTGFVSAVNNKMFDNIGDVYTKADEFVHPNTNITIPVNRLADYSVTVKAFDSYNNTFVNKSDDLCSVTVQSPSIEVIVNQQSSMNDFEFYGDNITFDTSAAMTTEEKNTLKDSFESIPRFPKNYTIYSAEHVIDDATITYDNISYAIDTPKAKDYIILTNLTERSDKVVVDSNTVTIHMDVNNPFKLNIFNATNGRVTLCVYDDEYREILAQCIDIPVVEVGYSSTDPYVKVNKSDVCSDLLSQIDTVNDKHNDINLYVINATEMEITSEQQTAIYNDKTTRTCFVPYGDDYATTFLEDTMVKIDVYYKNPARDSYVFVNECAYRVLQNITVDNLPYTLDDGTKVNVPGYIIDGLFCPDFMETRSSRNIYIQNDNDDDADTVQYQLSDFRFVMKPLHIVPVQYLLRVNRDSRERMYHYNDLFYSSYVTVEYNPRQLLFDSYFDDSYSATISTFEPLTAKQMWRNMSDTIVPSDYMLYVYKDFPVTIEKHRNVIIRPSIDMPQIRKDYQTLWRWKSYGIEDFSNWREYVPNKERILLFESKNKVLTVSPDMLGPQFIELYCMDVYGNIIVNRDGGNIFVDSPDEFSSPATVRQ